MGPLLLSTLMYFGDRILSVDRHSPGLDWAYSRGSGTSLLNGSGTDAFTGVPQSSTYKKEELLAGADLGEDRMAMFGRSGLELRSRSLRTGRITRW